MPLVLGGPSGVGKSTLCDYLKQQGWLYLEADQYPLDGIDELNLRTEWNEFWDRGDAALLADALMRRKGTHVGVVLSLPSGAVPPAERLHQNAAFLTMRFLWGEPSLCRTAFIEREKHSGRNLPVRVWDTNNPAVFRMLSSSAYAPFLVNVFTLDGMRLDAAEIVVKF